MGGVFFTSRVGPMLTLPMEFVLWCVVLCYVVFFSCCVVLFCFVWCCVLLFCVPSCIVDSSPSCSSASLTSGTVLEKAVTQLMQGGNNSILGTLLKGPSGDNSNGDDGRQKWQCRSCKSIGHS